MLKLSLNFLYFAKERDSELGIGSMLIVHGIMHENVLSMSVWNQRLGLEKCSIGTLGIHTESIDVKSQELLGEF